ncbi:hypothetical protein NEFER03_0795 [Nematocida sp. LUAm3]|nr:hypothetical protein NEFER03_0795 [Nematocida sp. LUAm3]KAI5174820.1 hypothetical protein NEFER02_0920 [Nematocida sp. LUAm2]KAI5177425.1 hypothetical protein NEFER01_0675 [Nematocida sp. LUAm1]
MISYFHFRKKLPAKKDVTLECVTLEDVLELPEVEDVDVLPETLLSKNTERLSLDISGTEVLRRVYMCSEPLLGTIKSKGVSREEYRP